MSKVEKDYDLGERQFDSLRATKAKIDKRLMLTGLEIVNQQNKIKKVMQILHGLDKETLDYLCEKFFLSNTRDLPYCNGYTRNVSHPDLSLELVKMYVNDQIVRGADMDYVLSMYHLRREYVGKSLNMETTDEENRNRLKAIIVQYGFPTKPMVGSEAMHGIFLIIQHADKDREWQKSQLANIEIAAMNGDVDGQSYAYLYDRIKIGAGEKQLYGTQFTSVDPQTNQIQLAPIDDPDNLDERRRQMGMMPIDAYKRLALISSKK